MKGWSVFGIIVALALIAFGIFYPVPKKHVKVDQGYKAYDYDWMENKGAQYVGGDAYNYQVEATLKAGYMAGVLAMKAITFVGGILLFFISVYAYCKGGLSERLNELAYSTSVDVKDIKKICENP